MESVQVEILGQTYTIKGVADRAYILELASYVDTRMRETQKGTGTSDLFRVAVLTAINISDELFRLRKEQRTVRDIAEAAAERLLEITEAPHKD